MLAQKTVIKSNKSKIWKNWDAIRRWRWAHTRCIQKYPTFFSPTAFNQITRAKRGSKYIHSCIIVKSFKPIHQTILFLQCIHCSHIVHARRFYDLTKNRSLWPIISNRNFC